MENIKTQRLNSDIFRVLTIAVQQKLNDAALDGVSILRIDINGNLSEVKVYVGIAGDHAAGLAALERANGFLRGELAQNIRMKQVPKLKFVIDKGVENAARVEELLKRIHGN